MKTSSFALRQATLLEKLAAVLAMLAIVTLSVPLQALAVEEPVSTDTPALEAALPAEEVVQKEEAPKAEPPKADDTLGTPEDTNSATSNEALPDETEEGLGEEEVVTESFARVALMAAPEEAGTCVIQSDPSTTYNGNPSVAVSPIHPAWTANKNGATWIWSENPIADAANATSATFTKKFTLTTLPTSGTLEIAADNSYKVALNGVLFAGDSEEFNYEQDGPGNRGQDTVTIPVSNLVLGENTLTFAVTNFAMSGGTMATNPAGLLYTATLNNANANCTQPPPPPPPTSTVTLCKIDNQERPLSGWRLYLEGQAVQNLSVPTNSSTGINSNPLVAGMSYLAKATGTWLNQGGANPVDAEYSTTDGWATHMDGYTGFGVGILETEINEVDGSWGPYNSAHQYAQSFVQATNGSANFRIFDGDTNTHTQNLGWFGDNSGTVGISLSKGYAGTTGENGCVTFTGVPYGTYTVGETPQDGWTPVSGNGATLVVDSSTETATIVNQRVVVEPVKYKVHIFKYLNNGETTTQIPNESTAPDFPMIATYAIAGLATNLNPGDGYVLGNGGGVGGSDDGLRYAANTVPLSAGDTYGTYEVTGGNSPVVANAQSCSPGKYYLEGYKVGDTKMLAEAAAVSSTAPNFPSISKDQYVIVVNRACPAGNENPGGDTTSSHTTIVSGNTAMGENQPGWLFNRDLATQSPFSFTNSTPSIGTGSLFVPPITNSNVSGIEGNDPNKDKFIGELFLITPLPGVKSISYDFNIAAPSADAKNQFYLSVYTNFGDSSPTKFYDCRYNIVPTVGVVNGYTTVTFDPTLSYDVTTRTGGSASPRPCPASPAAMDALDGAGTPTLRAIALNVGDTSAGDAGVSGYLDKVVTVIKTGTNTHTETYDFEAAAVITPSADPVVEEENNSRRGRSGGRSGGGSGGSVLGASTSAEEQGQVLGASCSLLLPNYLKMGWLNNVTEVKDLQTFLNADLAMSLPVTGFFGMLTESAVKAFQTKYGTDVLAPWVGLPGSDVTSSSDATGFVYKTTQWKINMLHCPELNLPLPPIE